MKVTLSLVSEFGWTSEPDCRGSIIRVSNSPGVLSLRSCAITDALLSPNRADHDVRVAVNEKALGAQKSLLITGLEVEGFEPMRFRNPAGRLVYSGSATTRERLDVPLLASRNIYLHP